MDAVNEKISKVFNAVGISGNKQAAAAGTALAAIALAAVVKSRKYRTAREIMRRVKYLFVGKTLEEQVLEHVVATATRGDSQSVLDAIDGFARTSGFLMNVGDGDKGSVLVNEVRKATPKVAIECGAYIGYSAILIARAMPPGSMLFSLEVNPLFAAIATKIVEFAGLAQKVTILIGPASEHIPELAKVHPHGVQLVFLDHWKDMYVPDIKLVESSGLLAPLAVVVADNVIFPGAPEYLEYIRGHPLFTSTHHKSFLEYSTEVVDAVEVSVYDPSKAKSS